mgnify:CR=1 FL=1
MFRSTLEGWHRVCRASDFIDLFGDIEQAGFVFQDQSNGADRLRVTAVIARNAKGAQRFPDDRVHGEHLLEICDEKIVRRKQQSLKNDISQKIRHLPLRGEAAQPVFQNLEPPFQSIIILFFYFCLESWLIFTKNERRRPAPMGKREKLSEQTGSPSTPGETFLKAAGQYAGLEDDGFFINHEGSRPVEGGTMPTLFSTTGLDVMETGKRPRSYEAGAFLAQQVT